MDEQEELAALQELQRRIEKARAIMESDSHHDLNFGQVMSVLSMFGQRLEEKEGEEYVDVDWDYCLDISKEQKAAELPGRERRQWNALLCAEKIVGFWSYPVVEEYLSVVERCWFEESSLENPIFNEYKNYLSNIDLRDEIESAKLGVLLQEPFDSPNHLPSDVLSDILSTQIKASKSLYQATSAYGAIETILGVAIRDELNRFDANKIYPDQWHGEWYCIPSAIQASYAFAGFPGSRHDPLDDAQARREFWTWWLDDAVPASWNLEYLDSDLRYRP